MKAESGAYVLDASVAAKWFLKEEDFVEESEAFLIAMLNGQLALHAPVLLKHELAHVLTKAQRGSKRISPAKCVESYQLFSELPIIYHDLSDEAMLDIIRFANKYHRGSYDSTYICLARSLNYTWLTSERRFSKHHLPSGFPSHLVLTIESF